MSAEESGAGNGPESAPEKPRKGNRTTWGPNNPPPRSPGRPPKGGRPVKPPPEPVLEGGLPDRLAACRAALVWNHPILPENGLVRHYVELKQESIATFQTTWNKLEAEWKAERGENVSPEGAGAPTDQTLEPDPASVKIIESLDAWLDRRREAAIREAREIEGRK